MLLPLSLLFVGAVLTLNGLWMMNRISDGEIVIINLATAFIAGAVALLVMSGADTLAAVKTAALTLLFSITCSCPCRFCPRPWTPCATLMMVWQCGWMCAGPAGPHCGF
jgi:hypothetical protein